AGVDDEADRGHGDDAGGDQGRLHALTDRLDAPLRQGRGLQRSDLGTGVGGGHEAAPSSSISSTTSTAASAVPSAAPATRARMLRLVGRRYSCAVARRSSGVTAAKRASSSLMREASPSNSSNEARRSAMPKRGYPPSAIVRRRPD